jgi:hypothetical protein
VTEPSENGTPDSPSSGSTAGPFLGALAIIIAVVITIVLLNVFSGGEPTDDQLIARAVSGQNDALQRQDYGAFRTYTCAEESGQESEILAAQRQSVDKRGERFVDGVSGVAVDGDRATADITYYFDNDRDAKETVEIAFVREDGTWKVCSTGPS